jgi:hypothetical protein
MAKESARTERTKKEHIAERTKYQLKILALQKENKRLTTKCDNLLFEYELLQDKTNLRVGYESERDTVGA